MHVKRMSSLSVKWPLLLFLSYFLSVSQPPPQIVVPSWHHGCQSLQTWMGETWQGSENLGRVGNEDSCQVKFQFLSCMIHNWLIHEFSEMSWLESFGLMGKKFIHGYFPGWFNANIREMPISHSCGIHPELRVLSEVWSGWSRHRDLWQASDCLVFQGQKLNAVAILKKHNSCLSPNVKRKHV